MDNSNLGNRMKNYEAVSKTVLMKRMPVAIRLDGKAFHTFTKGFQKPFDRVLMASMQETMKYLCENIQNAKFGYSQSDEITLILIDYQTFETSAWFDYEVQKMCSISASMATMAFNKFFAKNVENLRSEVVQEYEIDGKTEWVKSMLPYLKVYEAAIEKGAMFDARCFNIPKEEVANLIYWRQLDAMRNSVQMVGQANFSHKELQDKSCNDIKDMLWKEKGIDWNSFPTDCRRGSACIKTPPKEKVVEVLTVAEKPLRAVINCSSWFVDKHMPILKEDWNYINKYIYVEE